MTGIEFRRDPTPYGVFDGVVSQNHTEIHEDRSLEFPEHRMSELHATNEYTPQPSVLAAELCGGAGAICGSLG